jgi:hypothetical protein
MLAWIQSLDTRCQFITAALILVGTIVGGAWALDARYAKAEDMAAQAQTMQKSLTDIKVGQAQSDRRSLMREQFELENAKVQSGRLTTFEQRRLKAIEDDIKSLDQEIDMLRKGKP